MIKKLESDMLRTYDTKSRIELINTELKKRTSHLTELNDDLLHSLIYKMISVSPEEVVFCVAGKKNYDDKEFSEKRCVYQRNIKINQNMFTFTWLKTVYNNKVTYFQVFTSLINRYMKEIYPLEIINRIIYSILTCIVCHQKHSYVVLTLKSNNLMAP